MVSGVRLSDIERRPVLAVRVVRSRLDVYLSGENGAQARAAAIGSCGMSPRLIIGDVHEVLATMPENSVDLVVTSPPFLALRSYLPADHPDKAKEIGSEPTPGEVIDALLDVTEALARVLTPHGSICIELGDTYSGSGGAGGDYAEDGMHDGQP